MGVSDPDLKRLKLILAIFCIITFIYVCEFLCFSLAERTTIDAEFKEFQIDDIDEREEFKDIGSDMIGFIQFLTFTSENIPEWVTTVFLPIQSILGIIAIYLTADYLYDWIKALPLT